MADISMCSDEDCLIRTKCKRHPDSGTAASQWQSWSFFIKIEVDGEQECTGFMEKLCKPVKKKNN